MEEANALAFFPTLDFLLSLFCIILVHTMHTHARMGASY